MVGRRTLFFCISFLPLFLGLRDPMLMVYRFGADYHYEESHYFVGPWQYGEGDTVYILYELPDSEVSHINYVTGPYYGPGDLYDGDEGEFVPVTEEEDDGWYSVGSIDSVTVDVARQPVTNVYLVATIYEPPENGELIIEGNEAVWDSLFHEANGWEHPGAWSALFPVGNLPPHSIESFQVDIYGYSRVEFWAFSDENGNGIWDHSESFSPSSHNLTYLCEPSETKEVTLPRGKKFKAKVWPSLASGMLNIEIGKEWNSPWKLKIFDSQGREVYKGNFKQRKVTIPLRRLGSGVYHILIFTPGRSGHILSKVIVLE